VDGTRFLHEIAKVVQQLASEVGSVRGGGARCYGADCSAPITRALPAMARTARGLGLSWA